MSSQARINASRANGARSRGPKTAEGKAISSKNAIKHNILSERNLSPDDLSNLADIRDLLTTRHQPANEAETALVETLALARWRASRTRAIGIACFNKAILACVEKSPELATASPSERIARGFRNLVANSSLFELTDRYETTYHGQYTRTLEELRRLRIQPDQQNCETNLNSAHPADSKAPKPPHINARFQPGQTAPAGYTGEHA